MSSAQKRSSPDILMGCFILYVILVGVLTIASTPLSRTNGLSGINLFPVIRSVRCFVPNPGQPSTTLFCLRTIIGNMIMFVPLGVMLPLISRRVVLAETVFSPADRAACAPLVRSISCTTDISETPRIQTFRMRQR